MVGFNIDSTLGAIKFVASEAWEPGTDKEKYEAGIRRALDARHESEVHAWLRYMADDKTASVMLKRHGSICSLLVKELVGKATDLRLLSTISLIASGHLKELILNRMKELVAPPPPPAPKERSAGWLGKYRDYFS
jgi:hypothetical protein